MTRHDNPQHGQIDLTGNLANQIQGASAYSCAGQNHSETGRIDPTAKSIRNRGWQITGPA